MGRRGPAPQPTKLKIYNGNPGKRPLNASEPKPPSTLPKCPAVLRGVARRMWRRVTAELQTMGMLSSADTETIVSYCYTYTEFVNAAREVQAKGHIYRTPNGLLQNRPEVGNALKERQMLRILAAELGLTPSARSRIQVPGEPEEDELDKILGLN